jgi:hypothetical protein
MNELYFQHALDCGINMTGKTALPIEESGGRLLMTDISDPVTREVVIHSGTTMDTQLIRVCQSYGVDYAIVYRGRHTPARLSDGLDYVGK